MQNIPLSTTVAVKDLGVVFTSDLKWKNQTTQCASKANKVLGMLRNTFLSLNSEILKIIYTTFV